MTTTKATSQKTTTAKEVPRYECPCCMQDLKGYARACPACHINLPRDWLDARLWSMYGVVDRPLRIVYEWCCPLCDATLTLGGDCDECNVTGMKRMVEWEEE